MNIPWLPKKTIAVAASELIDNFQAMAKYDVKPPIPVEEIIERYLGLGLVYHDLDRVFNTRNTLGVTYVNKKTVCINERLFENEGRLVFTMAHEVGHWILHRKYIGAQEKGNPKKAFITQARDNKMEWQADYFASCLLMPEKEIREAFEKVCAPEPLIVKNSINDSIEISKEQPYLEQWPFIAAAICEAGGFSNVSKQAMIIRLQDLGLLVNKTGKKMDWEVFCGVE
jgi:Zn-dependent peptidase ImmA (M78 family)